MEQARLVLGDLGSVRALSIRHLSSYAKENGIATKLLFPLIPSKGFGKLPRLKPEQMRGVLAFLHAQGATHFGCYLMTGHFRAYKELVTFLRAQGWRGRIFAGGVHPTTRPEETLFEGVDSVVVGPGERALVDIVRETPPSEIGGLVYREGGRFVTNPMQPESQIPLDSLPFPDYEFPDHYVVEGPAAAPLTLTRFSELSGWGGAFYYLTTTRGCPYQCTFCCNTAKGKLRRASVPRVMAELDYARKKLPFLCGVNIQDDSFFTGSDEWVGEFCARLRADFGWPFIARIMPRFATRERLLMLKEGGLRYVSIGLQGSERMNRLYKRNETNDRFVNACRVMAELGIVYVVDVILDVVYEKDEDLREVARTLNRLPRPFKVMAYSMTPFPGSAFYDMVEEDGLLGRFGADAYESMFDATRPGAYKTATYWRNLIQHVIPLHRGGVDRLIEAGPNDPQAVAQVERMCRNARRKMVIAEWMRQHTPFVFDRFMAAHSFARRMWQERRRAA